MLKYKPTCHLGQKLPLLNFFKFIFSFDRQYSNTCTIYSKIFPSRDTECTIMFYTTFYLASQQMINKLTIQLLYTSWLNSLIINFITISYLLFLYGFSFKTTLESSSLLACSPIAVLLPHKLTYHIFPSSHFDHGVSLPLAHQGIVITLH